MLSAKEIMDIVTQWAHTPAGRAEIKKQTGLDYSGKVNRMDMKFYGELMKNRLFEHINPLIKSVQLDDIIVGNPTKTKDGKYSLTISFREGSMVRDSLIKGEKLQNIVLLFTKGYTARNYAYGVWKKPSGNVFVCSRIKRNPDSFLKTAVEEFNKAAKGVAVAKLTDIYK